jgi:hypothetical protein
MKTLIATTSILFSTLFWHVEATPMIEEQDYDRATTSKQGLLKVEYQDININKVFKAFNLHLMHSLSNEEEEKAIKELFSPEEFKAISNRGWEAANEGEDSLAFTCMYLGAVGELMADQQELATYFLNKKDYKRAAKWYIRSAWNKNPDVLAELHKIDQKSPIMHYFNKGNLAIVEDIIVNFWQEQERV